MPERRYDDREVGLILRRVAELHEREGDRAEGRGLTRREIEQVVTELGIPHALIARATAELAIRDVRNQPSRWLGGPTDLLFETVVPGAVDEATHDRILEALRRRLGDPGTLVTQGSARIWSTGQRLHLTLTHTGDATTIRLEQRMVDEAVAAVTVSGIVGLLAGIMSLIPLKVLLTKPLLLLLIAPVLFLWVLTGCLVGRHLWRRHGRAQEAALRAAFDEVLALTHSDGPARPEP